MQRLLALVAPDDRRAYENSEAFARRLDRIDIVFGCQDHDDSDEWGEDEYTVWRARWHRLNLQITPVDFSSHFCFESAAQCDYGTSPWQHFTAHPRRSRLFELIKAVKLDAQTTWGAAASLGKAFAYVPPTLGYVEYTKAQVAWLSKRLSEDAELLQDWLGTVRWP